MIIRKEIDLNAPLTDEQKQMLKALKDRPIEFDEDCPELTEEQLSQFKILKRGRNTPQPA